MVKSFALCRRCDLVEDGVGGGDRADVAEVDEPRLVVRGAGLGVDLVAVELAAVGRGGPMSERIVTVGRNECDGQNRHL